MIPLPIRPWIKAATEVAGEQVARPEPDNTPIKPYPPIRINLGNGKVEILDWPLGATDNTKGVKADDNVVHGPEPEQLDDLAATEDDTPTHPALLPVLREIALAKDGLAKLQASKKRAASLAIPVCHEFLGKSAMNFSENRTWSLSSLRPRMPWPPMVSAVQWCPQYRHHAARLHAWPDG
jgi:hypothetical protein